MRPAALGLLTLLVTIDATAATLAVLPARFNDAARAELPAIFDDFLLGAAHGAGGFDIIGEQDLAALGELETQQRQLDCDDWCLAEMIRGLGIDKQILIRVVRLADGDWLIVGKMMDAAAGRVEAMNSELVEGDARALFASMGQMVRSIMTGHRPTQVVRPSPFQDRLATRRPRARGRQCDFDDPRDCEEQCLRRHAGSCQTLATMYLMGRELPKVWGRSAIFYEQACELGAASACNNLGVLHHFGLGVEIDEARARSLFELACDAGDETGCEHLSRMLTR